uniref:Uncharacterized protein n=1 Tax=Steinernema glaseri TaxID=37863 RepID=A0A1I7YND9_9BILA
MGPMTTDDVGAVAVAEGKQPDSGLHSARSLISDGPKLADVASKSSAVTSLAIGDVRPNVTAENVGED